MVGVWRFCLSLLCSVIRAGTPNQVSIHLLCSVLTLLSAQRVWLLRCDSNKWRLQSLPVRLLQVCAHVKLGMGVVGGKKVCIYCLRSEAMEMKLHIPFFQRWWKGLSIWQVPVAFDDHSVLNPLGFFSLAVHKMWCPKTSLRKFKFVITWEIVCSLVICGLSEIWHCIESCWFNSVSLT